MRRFKAAALANNRINGLDDYEPIRLIPVLFKVNSSAINAKAKQAMDDAAAWAKAEKARGTPTVGLFKWWDLPTRPAIRPEIGP
jgi:hypothetical protein